MTTLLIIAAVWLVCGFIAYGLYLAHFQRQYPGLAKRYRMADVYGAILIGLTGPFGLIAQLGTNGVYHGFMLWPPKS